MNNSLYNLSNGLHTHLKYLGLLTSTGYWAYKFAIDLPSDSPEMVPKKEEMVTKVEEACKVEKEKVLEILEESKRQIEILIHSVSLQEGKRNG
tara:strand:- start:424 stop:702 length:279 start_codon:yes stop_codon:yes gene_type:complete